MLGPCWCCLLSYLFSVSGYHRTHLTESLGELQERTRPNWPPVSPITRARGAHVQAGIPVCTSSAHRAPWRDHGGSFLVCSIQKMALPLAQPSKNQSQESSWHSSFLTPLQSVLQHVLSVLGPKGILGTPPALHPHCLHHYLLPR